VRWVEVFTQSLSLNATPLHADMFARQIEGHPRAWIFTSATLAVGKATSRTTAASSAWTMAGPAADTGCWGSPFDYPSRRCSTRRQAMPDPTARLHRGRGRGRLAADPRQPRPRLRAVHLLRAMRRIHELILTRLRRRKGLRPPLLLQGEGSRSELLERFRRLGNAVLVASQSFWEGVDVPGEALSLVVIDKLPFAPPDDPVLAARVEHMKKQGRTPSWNTSCRAPSSA
jgi:ATP-dependent DNA helicase DinG